MTPRVLVTGAAGMLGRDVAAAAAGRGWACAALTHAELDITDAAAVRTTVRDRAPQVIFNCAAWTRVDDAEEHEAAALALNADGPGNLAAAARDAGARLIHLSTDYVFDGRARRPYVESDPTGPTSAYGRTKLAGEHAVLSASPEHLVVRTAWLFGAGRANFVTFVLDCARSGRPIPAIEDQFGCPTYSVHLAHKLLDLAFGDRGGVFHEAAASHCSRLEFSQAILAAAGLRATITPTLRATQAADRPAWSVLTSERDDEPLPSWREGLAAFLAEAPR